MIGACEVSRRAKWIAAFVIVLVILGALGNQRKGEASEPGDEVFQKELAEVERLKEDTQFYPALEKIWGLQKKYTDDKARAKQLRRMAKRLQKQRMRAADLFSHMEKLGHEYEAVRRPAAAKVLAAGDVGLLFLRKAVREGQGHRLREAVKLLVRQKDVRTVEPIILRLGAIDDADMRKFLMGSLGILLNEVPVDARPGLRPPIRDLLSRVRKDDALRRQDDAEILFGIISSWFNGELEELDAYLKEEDAHTALKAYVQKAAQAKDPALRSWGWAHAGIVGMIPEGIAGWWRFDEGKGDKAEDDSGNGSHGTLQGGVKWTDGVIGKALLFDGSDDYVTLGNSKALQLAGDQTISLWIKAAALDGRRNPFAKAYGGEGTMTLEPDGTVNYYYGQAGGDSEPYQGLTMTKAVQPKVWTHLVIVRDLKGRKLHWYKNGVKTDGADARFPTAKPSSKEAFIGRGYVQPFRGAIDDVRIYKRALSAEEVGDLYKAAAP